MKGSSKIVIKVRHLRSTCHACGSKFEPRSSHYELLAQRKVSSRLRRRHRDWQYWHEACPDCVEDALAPRFRIPLLSRLAG